MASKKTKKIKPSEIEAYLKQHPALEGGDMPILAILRGGGDVILEASDPRNPGVKHARRKAPFALDSYYSRHFLSPNHFLNRILFQAGDRLREDFTAAGLEPRVCMRWGEQGGRPEGGGNSAEQSRIANLRAYESFWRAGKAIGEGSGIVIDVACFGTPAGEGRRMEILRAGLTRLAVHYGLLTRTQALRISEKVAA